MNIPKRILLKEYENNYAVYIMFAVTKKSLFTIIKHNNELVKGAIKRETQIRFF